jgi:hypothetical protein
MLVKSSKSRFAAMALMALGVSTFMGTSAALATGTDVNVTGTVGECAVASTVTADAVVAFGEVTKGTIGSKTLTTVIKQGKKSDCSDRGSDVTAAIGTFTGAAESSVTLANRVTFDIEAPTLGVFPIKANVPATATATGTFGAKVTLTLSDNT